MKKLSDITSKFKKTKFRVQMTAQAAIDVQKAMFSMGFREYYSQSGTRRVARTESTSYGGGPIHAFYIDKDNRIECSGVPGTFGKMTSYREIAILEVFEAAKEFKALKKELRKQRQAEKKMAGWTYVTEAKDVPVGTRIDITFKDKSTLENWSYNCKSLALLPLWYRPTKPATPAVSLADMVANIVSDAGGVEVDSDGYIVWNGGKCPVAAGTRVDVKYRKHGVKLNVPALVELGSYNADARFWRNDNHESDIVAYRLTKPELELVPMEPAYVPVGEVTSIPDTNPKRQFGVSSVPLNMWSPLASAYGSLALYNGSLKYGKANFANTPVEASIYIAAAFRHLSAWASGQEFDPADGVPNLAGVLANVAILLESRAAGMLIDDRLLMSGYLKEIDALKEIVKSLNELHAGKNPHHYTIGG